MSTLKIYLAVILFSLFGMLMFSALTPTETKNTNLDNTLSIPSIQEKSHSPVINEEVKAEIFLEGTSQESIKKPIREETINKEIFIPDPPCAATGEFKSWTPYTIYAKWSEQYKLQQLAHTDSNGLRKVGEYFCVALGSYYGDEIGLLYEITLEDNGERKTFKAVLCDQKSDRHTDSTHRYTKKHGCMVEFAIDTKTAQKVNSIVYHGTVSVIDTFRGKVIKIKCIGKMDILTGEIDINQI